MKNTKHLLAIILTILITATLAAAADVSGPWKVTVDADGEVLEVPITIEQNGTEVTAKVGDDLIKGTFKDNVLTMTGKVYNAGQGYSAKTEMTGKLAGEKITGDLTWDLNPAKFTMTRGE